MAYKKRTLKTIKKMVRGRSRTLKLLREVSEKGTFKIEKDPPPPVRLPSAELLKFHDKLNRTVEAVPVGGAFIIPAQLKNSAQKHLKETFDNFRFRTFLIADNEDELRVYKFPNGKPTR